MNDKFYLYKSLELLQKDKNNGRGVSCVQTIIFYLKNGERDKANAVVSNEWDKISCYPDIADFLVQHNFIELMKFK